MALGTFRAAFARLPRATRGIAWMAMAAFFYASAYVAARQSVKNLSVPEVAFLRSLLIAVVMLAWIARSGLASLRTRRIGLHVVRAAFTYAAILAWIYAVGHMRISDVTAINFSSPLFTVLFTFLFLGESVGPHRLAALVLGFLGVLLILRPVGVEFALPALSALISAALFAASHGSARALGSTEKANAMVFYLFGLASLMGFGPAMLDWKTPSWSDMGWLSVLAGVTLFAQQGLTRALIAAPASLVMPFNFLQLPIVAVFGLVLFGEVSDIWTWTGAVVIFGSSYYIARRESRRARASDAVMRDSTL